MLCWLNVVIAEVAVRRSRVSNINRKIHQHLVVRVECLSPLVRVNFIFVYHFLRVLLYSRKGWIGRYKWASDKIDLLSMAFYVGKQSY